MVVRLIAQSQAEVSVDEQRNYLTGRSGRGKTGEVNAAKALHDCLAGTLGLHLPSIGEQRVPIRGTPPGSFPAIAFSQDLCPPHTCLFRLLTRWRLIAPAMPTGTSLKTKQYLVCCVCRTNGLPYFMGCRMPPRSHITWRSRSNLPASGWPDDLAPKSLQYAEKVAS